MTAAAAALAGLTTWDGPHGLPRFDRVDDAAWPDAFDAALARAQDAVAAIIADPAPPTFANTLSPMETAETPLNRLCAVFYTLAGVDSNPAREAFQREIAPRLAAYNAAIALDPRLYARVRAVVDAGRLAPEDARLAETTLKDLTRAGAGLTPDQRTRMADIRARLAVLTTQFSQNVLTDERDYVLDLPEDRLAGLSDALVAAMRAAGAARGRRGPVVTLSRSLIVPFLEQSTDRPLRETAFRAWQARGTGTGAGGAGTDNGPIIAEILALRHERAQLLGQPDFATWKLDDEMAGTPDAVADLLHAVWAPARARVAADAAALEALAAADGLNGALAAWDWRHYAARRRADEQAFDEAAVKPYLSLDAMLGAVFDVARRLFGLEFAPIPDAPLWAPEARAWQVSRDGHPLAVFIGDFFARPGKRSGAWCSALQKQHKIGAGQRPIVVNVCNFTPPAGGGQPALLSWDDAHTLFHEFGHATHHILSDVTWPSLSGTSVAQDFVELPSQLYEHWLDQPAVIAAHARHYATGAPMPHALVRAVLAADKAGRGFATVEYLRSALVDLALHRGAPRDPAAVEAEIAAALDAPAAIPMRHGTAHFSHVFAGDSYAAGYYSYLWSEVMDADAFAAFEETGDVFDPATARRLEETILSRGGSAPAADLWSAFRGRMPGVGPLLAGRGLA